jgi:hypothetical protein
MCRAVAVVQSHMSSTTHARDMNGVRGGCVCEGLCEQSRPARIDVCAGIMAVEATTGIISRRLSGAVDACFLYASTLQYWSRLMFHSPLCLRGRVFVPR